MRLKADTTPATLNGAPGRGRFSGTTGEYVVGIFEPDEPVNLFHMLGQPMKFEGEILLDGRKRQCRATVWTNDDDPPHRLNLSDLELLD